MQPGERVEVPFTHNHWEAAHLASAVPLARGWERQLDEKANALFYDGRPLTPARYQRWLRDAGVRWVALPDAPLDYSAGPRRGCSSAAAVSAARRTARPAGASGRCATPHAAGLRRRARDRGAVPNGFDVDTRRADGRAAALHALVAVRRRLRHAGARRVDARDTGRPRPRARAGRASARGAA